jgi:hypothetical protein
MKGFRISMIDDRQKVDPRELCIMFFIVVVFVVKNTFIVWRFGFSKIRLRSYSYRPFRLLLCSLFLIVVLIRLVRGQVTEISETHRGICD